MSAGSPGLIADDEVILRMVCVPMHVHSKKPELKSSFFSHAFTYGASAQRGEHATNAELAQCVTDLIGGAVERVWLGYVQCTAAAVREVLGANEARGFCVYDAALPPRNPAHAEVHSAQRIPEAEQIELRVKLMNAFNGKSVRGRRELRDGAVWAALAPDLQSRAVALQWAALQ